MEDGQQTVQDCAMFCMELVTRGDFFELIMNSDFMDESVCKTFFVQIIAALAFMHEQGIAHRDLKPQNCLLDQNFTIKIADFGFSCPLSGTT